MTWNPEHGVRGPLEVVCDESGSDGENLTGGNTDVFAHGSVSLPLEVAAAYVQEVRDRIRSPATEYKAGHLLREKHRDVLEWLLSPSGPIDGHAHVHLTEKAYFVVNRTVDLLLGDGTEALALYREDRPAVGAQRWRGFLDAANRLLRVRLDGEADGAVDGFFRTVDDLRSARPRSQILERLATARPRADAYRARLLEGPPLIPVLNPLLPAIVHTVAHWSAGGRTVRVVHDRQNMLTEQRIAWIERQAVRAGAGFEGMELVQARWDPRIQLADFLAGIARKVASDVLNGHVDPVLVELLRPYVGPTSVWGDGRSWAVLWPGPVDGVAPAPSADVNFAV
ncbi:hypothetical protein EJC51_41885 [Streptomyces aquilus]|uniref:DUF3800 domain-containing protein n=1 Tax=Streptomyces aquilus TaxID=2548456 RepID=A0A3Q9C2N2_9ACTN|nr:hypothetical protein [Streptomyces aquilus]AZP22075.1 hypothetical protein EJC51_41885 [Streptomyces aquilus]